MHVLRTHLLVLSAIVFTGCASATGSEDQTELDIEEFELVSDKDSYVAAYLGGEHPFEAYGFTLTLRFTNHSRNTVYLSRCLPDTPYPTYGIGLSEGTISSAYNPVWPCVGHRKQFVVAPGAMRYDNVLLVGPNGYSGQPPKPFGTLVGQMKMFYEVRSCRGDAQCDYEVRPASNAFSVVVQ